MKFILLLASLTACASQPPQRFVQRKPTAVSASGQVNYTMPQASPTPGAKVIYSESTVNNYYYCKPVSK